MNRRGFIGALAAAFVAPDPEQLLWRPGARLISVPRARVFIGPPFTPGIIIRYIRTITIEWETGDWVERRGTRIEAIADCIEDLQRADLVRITA